MWVVGCHVASGCAQFVTGTECLSITLPHITIIICKFEREEDTSCPYTFEQTSDPRPIVVCNSSSNFKWIKVCSWFEEEADITLILMHPKQD